jgi:hypothetical protein
LGIIFYVAGDVVKRLQWRIYNRKKQRKSACEFDYFKPSQIIIWAQESRMIRWACGTHGEVDEGFWLGRLKKKSMRRHGYRLEAGGYLNSMRLCRLD